MKNLVARLREAGPYLRTCHTEGHWNTEQEAADCEAAADEIERLQARSGLMTIRPIIGQPCLICGGYWVPMLGGSVYHECRVGGAADDPPATDSSPGEQR